MSLLSYSIQGREFTYNDLLTILPLVSEKARKLERRREAFPKEAGKKDWNKIGARRHRKLASKIAKILDRG